ncbi:ornithine decarboxylase 2-like isoform X2 [Megachile rotundata]|uniref:ornithine decarboxylase 2-like isoform X2 n=1 Tax=Megachile rotundata TaxID=143995 RepID=UPI000614A957|nr:PREDICTED: ornithine decarboxylase 2-like isoform X1 [Megachile rotundata]
MSRLSFAEVKQFEDATNDFDIIKDIIDNESQEEPFYILDVNDLMRKHLDWISKMPRVTPHYAVKCNPHPMVVKVLAAMNASFDCATEQEIRQVMKHGVIADRIIFANPTKCPSHIKFAKKMNVEKMTVDSEIELLKINDLFPEAKIVIRIRCDAAVTLIPLGAKFGCDPGEEAVQLMHLTKSLGLNLHGFSFHVGSPCGELKAYSRGIAMCKRLIAIAKSIGFNDVQLIDIGGGFPGDTGYCIDKLAKIINNAIVDIDPSISIISEPGQYYVTSAFTLASYLHTKKIIPKGDKTVMMYYMNCGVYNSFIEELLNFRARIPIPLHKPTSDELFTSFVWGPTCDSLDCILKNVLLPELHIGDWLVWRDMGAYSIPLCCPFNGFEVPKVYPVIRKSQWEAFSAYINAMQKSQKTICWKNGIENAFIKTS